MLALWARVFVKVASQRSLITTDALFVILPALAEGINGHFDIVRSGFDRGATPSLKHLLEGIWTKCRDTPAVAL